MKQWIVISHEHDDTLDEFDNEVDARAYYEKIKAVGVCYVTLVRLVETTVPEK